MASNKERIENLEVELGGLQDSFSRMEMGVNEKLLHLEDAISKISGALFESPSKPGNGRQGHSFSGRDRDPNLESRDSGSRSQFASKLAKLEFPRYSGYDPTEWLNRVEQFFEYQETHELQKVSLASFHLEREANQWWQWLRRVYEEENKEISWAIFVEELWAHFGSTDSEDSDEALAKIKQMGSLRDYQRELERLGNRVQGWS